MPVDLNKPIDLTKPEWQAAFTQLQANIFKGHGHDYIALIPMTLEATDRVRSCFGEFASRRVTSASEQMARSWTDKDPLEESAEARPVMGGVYVSIWGYLKLGYCPRRLELAFPHPRDEENTNWFLEGMQQVGRYILDPPKVSQQPEYRDANIDAMLLIAADNESDLQDEVNSALAEMQGWARPIAVEKGRVLRRDGYVIEPFGYRDGISRPNHFKKDSPEYQPPGKIIVPDLLAGNPDAYGSYLVYRKLEQNVKAFHEAETAIATELGLPEEDRERAGAMIVGRFRDGTPLTLHPTAGNPTNDFSHDGDQGLRCPMHAHIRKVRPRTEGNYRDRMVRRGIPYGPYDPTTSSAPPETGTGLLFMSFQADLQHQFGQAIARWVNDVHFEAKYTGQDPLLGHGSIPVKQEQNWPKVWNQDDSSRFQCGASPKLVTFKGGEFLFAPSLAWFHSLA